MNLRLTPLEPLGSGGIRAGPEFDRLRVLVDAELLRRNLRPLSGAAALRGRLRRLEVGRSAGG